MVVDPSALLAVLFRESDGPAFEAALAGADDPMMSAAGVLEASILAESRGGADSVKDLDELIATLGIRIVAVDDMQAYIALEGFHKYGKGRSAAGLNFGDCFSYALAIYKGRPLLFKGDDFAQTNVTPAA